MSLSGGGERAPVGAIRRVGVVARAGGQGVLDSLAAVVQTLRAAGADVTLEAETARMLSSPHGVARPAIGDGMDLVVVVGGDGSILGVARDVARTDVAVLGVNRGGLGFLADISPDQIAAKLPAVLRGEHTVEERFLLEARVWRAGRSTGAADPALNDVVVHAGSMSRMMDFSLFVDDEFVYSQRSDGLIVSTPTGSTAYALSAGGPIMHPRLDAMVIVPMFPHTLTSRPLVVHGQSRVRVRVGRTGHGPRAVEDSAATVPAKTGASPMVSASPMVNASPMVSCDSQLDRVLRDGDEVCIAKHPHALRLAFPNDHSFYGSCRDKLDWATRLRGR